MIEDLVKEALEEPQIEDLSKKDVGKVLYQENNHLNRIGLVFPKVSQVDTLTFIPLDKKVLSILSGNPNFTADDSVDMEFDEPKAEDWNSQNDDLEVFPIDEYSDKVDVREVLVENEKRGEVFATAVKELQDKENVQKSEQKSEQNENSTQNK